MDSEALRNIVQDFVDNETEICQDHYRHLCAMLFPILREENPRLPFPLVIAALYKLAWSPPPLTEVFRDWFDVVKVLCDILKSTKDDQVMSSIFEFLFSLPGLCFGAFNIVMAKLDALPDSELRVRVIVSLRRLIADEFDENSEDYPSEHSLSIMLSLLDDDDAELIHSVIESIASLVSLFLKCQKGVDIILSSQLLPTLMEKLKTWNTRSPPVFETLTKMCKESDVLRSRIVALGFTDAVCSVLLKTKERLCKYRDFQADFIFPLLVLKEIVRDTRNMGEEAWSHVVISLVSLMVALEPSEKVSSQAKDLLFETLYASLADMNDEKISHILTDTIVLPSLAGVLNYSSNVSLIERSKTLLQMMEFTHPNLVEDAYVREGVYAGLSKVQGTQESTTSQLRRAQSHNLGQLQAELKKKLSNGSEDAHEVALSALKEINKVDKNGNRLITGFEYIRSGFSGTFLIYLLHDNSEPAKTTNSKKRCKSLSIWEEDDCDMEEDEDFLNFRIKCFLCRCLKTGEDIQDLVNSLAHIIGKALSFMRFDSMEMSITDHACLAKNICFMKKSDPRHDHMLMANVVNRASTCLPSLEAEWLANSNYKAKLQGVCVFSLGIKEYRATSLTKGAMQSDMFNHCVYDEETPVPEDVSIILLDQYPFVFSFDIRKECVDVCIDITLFNGSPDRDRKEVLVDRNSLLHTSRIQLQYHCISDTKFSTLYVGYVGEQGSGRGPTTEFFTLISQELQKNKEMWRGDITTGGLFPRPWSSLENIHDLCFNFRLLGQVMAIALKDGRLLDIHLSQAFYKLAIHDQPLSLYDICSFDVGLGLRLLEFNAIVQARKSKSKSSGGKSARTGKRAPVFTYKGATFRQMGLDYVVPGFELDYNVAEYPGQKLGLGNLKEYVEDVQDATVGTGVERQIAAFQIGFSQILPLSGLKIFREDEMDSLFCGQSNINEEWTSENLHRYIDFEFQSNQENPESTLAQEDKERIKGWVIGALMELKVDDKDDEKVDERIEFLKYATATSRLPRGGFGKLNPRLRFTVTTTTNDDMLPTVMTCVHLLTIPRYSSQKIIKDKILFAITHGQGHYAFA